jgi:ribosomal-protein-alanine N-acetyltransferase
VSRTITASGADAAALLAALHAEAFPHDPWSEEAMTRLLAMPGSFALIAAENDDPAGLVLARIAADEAEIVTLGVVPRFARRGIGRSLAAAAADRAASLGAVRLFLEVGTGNLAARGLYGTLGFREVGRRSGYYPGGEDAVVLALPLSPPCAA